MLISNAFAQTAPATSGSGLLEFLPLVIVCAVFYFLLLRPQQKRAKEQRAMLAALQKGDEIVTIGGQIGRVSKVGETYVSLEIADNLFVHIQKNAVQTVLPKGTIKSI
ncbi:preprotein translocase subunit YajC [Candidatus Nitrotoga fabula]|uniref:Sec translocon accessory complex subunit YajC n=1 Tax=Candidatus Nitrotoga fabula TaxID=2182327 RepID=A0A916BEB0_9PROT|nr:preprotein translocase subunit YajC [Candidatus Nitrotoga fabula]CAE6734176.1 Sec translocon accessory complex subunit YajC [Candidatus Nitrotoga fabula]